MDLSRRHLLAALPAALLVRPTVLQAAGANRVAVIGAARQALARHGGSASKHAVIGVADFSAASDLRRFHMVDLAAGRIESLLVAHGRGSDPDHRGWVQHFSNEQGSAATSDGVYLTGAEYEGKHGRSMRLKGLDTTNNNAEPRAVVIHGAWYVGPKMLADHGKLGRSEGCFAFDEQQLAGVLERLGPGALIAAGKF